MKRRTQRTASRALGTAAGLLDETLPLTPGDDARALELLLRQLEIAALLADLA